MTMLIATPQADSCSHRYRAKIYRFNEQRQMPRLDLVQQNQSVFAKIKSASCPICYRARSIQQLKYP